MRMWMWMWMRRIHTYDIRSIDVGAIVMAVVILRVSPHIHIVLYVV